MNKELYGWDDSKVYFHNIETHEDYCINDYEELEKKIIDFCAEYFDELEEK